VERESTKHNPRVDEELKKEVESIERGAPVEPHKQEFRDKEGPADDERPVAARTAPPEQLGPDETAARTELSRFLRMTVFPAERENLLAEANENGAPEPIVAKLAALPAGRIFANVYDVWATLGGEVEHAAGRPDRHRSQPQN
jgi:uncharacterized protein DUF2795